MLKSSVIARSGAPESRNAQVDDHGSVVGVKDALAAICLGDWHPLLRDPLDLFRLSFLVGAVVFALQGDSRPIHEPPASDTNGARHAENSAAAHGASSSPRPPA